MKYFDDFRGLNWGMLVVLLGSIFVWYAILTIGFFHTIFWMILGAVVGGLIIKIKEKRNDYTRYIG